jgi:hypothetical protein
VQEQGRLHRLELAAWLAVESMSAALSFVSSANKVLNLPRVRFFTEVNVDQMLAPERVRN